jgi:hypothetical protein
MILIPRLLADALELLAYSYQNEELDIVRSYLRENDIEFNSRQIANDRDNRRGLLYNIAGLFLIQRFENVLGVKFRGQGMATSVEFKPGDGLPYRCLRIGKVAWEKGCADITADGDHAAFLKCALLANEKNWFGVESEQGKCKL